MAASTDTKSVDQFGWSTEAKSTLIELRKYLHDLKLPNGWNYWDMYAQSFFFAEEKKQQKDQHFDGVHHRYFIMRINVNKKGELTAQVTYDGHFKPSNSEQIIQYGSWPDTELNELCKSIKQITDIPSLIEKVNDCVNGRKLKAGGVYGRERKQSTIREHLRALKLPMGWNYSEHTLNFYFGHKKANKTFASGDGVETMSFNMQVSINSLGNLVAYVGYGGEFVHNNNTNNVIIYCRGPRHDLTKLCKGIKQLSDIPVVIAKLHRSVKAIDAQSK